jgi:aspartyl-tRNA synthetase
VFWPDRHPKGNAFLAQSPQLAKQMAIAADFERVYEIAPVFRAEDSNTHRHLTEFIGLDLEMTIEEHYHEVMELLDGLFKHMFKSLKEKYRKEIDAVGTQFPADDFKWKEETLKLTFSQAVDLLVEDGVDRAVLDDIKSVGLVSRNRIADTSLARRTKKGSVGLSRLSMTPTISSSISSRWNCDRSIPCRTPIIPCVLYTLCCRILTPYLQELSNSYDFFMRGEEILSGAQRIHDAALLAEKMRSKGVDPNSMKGYLDAFRMGCAPHGGGGIGLERVLMLFLKLNNIRRASLFPRDPKRLEP